MGRLSVTLVVSSFNGIRPVGGRRQKQSNRICDESLSQNLIENVKLDVDLHVVSLVYEWNERSNGDLVFA